MLSVRRLPYRGERTIMRRLTRAAVAVAAGLAVAVAPVALTASPASADVIIGPPPPPLPNPIPRPPTWPPPVFHYQGTYVSFSACGQVGAQGVRDHAWRFYNCRPVFEGNRTEWALYVAP
jgi:hypothetical protein